MQGNPCEILESEGIETIEECEGYSDGYLT